MANELKASASALEAEETDRQFVTALARGLQILRCFRTEKPELGTTEIAQRTGLPQPTVWRLCHTLLKCGYLAPAPGQDKLRLGAGVLSLGYEAIGALDIGEFAQREMQSIADDFGAALSLSIPDQLDMLIVKRAQGNTRLVVNLQVGSRLPIAGSTMGWAYLAVMPEPQRAALLKRLETHYGKRDWKALWQKASTAIKNYHETGYTLSNRVYDAEINAIAIPIQGDNNTQFFAMACGAPAAAIPIKTFQSKIAPRLMRVGEAIKSALSHQGVAGRMR